MRQRLQIALLVATVLVIYGNSLRNGFTMDDFLYISKNPQVTAPTLGGLFGPNNFSHVVRPVTFATFAANWWIGGEHALGYHVVNLLLHAAVICLLYLLLKLLLAPLPNGDVVAFAAALLFAVHPIHTEAVSSIVGRSELLAAGFLIAAWIFHLHDREIAALLCFVLAMFSKESALVFLPLALAGDYGLGRVKSFPRYARIGVITLLYAGVLWKFHGGHLSMANISRMDNPLAQIAPHWRILNALRVAWEYIGLQIFPRTLSCDYSFNAIPIYMNLRDTLPWAMAAVAVLLLWCWAVWKRKLGWLLAGTIYFAGFATTANILLPVGTIMGERLTYFPSIGFCLLIALIWNWLRQRQRAAALGALALVVAALGARTMVRNADWKDDFALYSAAVRAVPQSAKMHANLGLEYMNSGAPELARKQLQDALQIEPEYPDALESYGLLEARVGNEQKGGHMLEQALYMSNRDNPNYDYMAVNLAALMIKSGYLDGAMDILNRDIAESPLYARAWANRAVIHFKQGDTAAARSDAEMARRLDPANPLAVNVLQMLNAPQRPTRMTRP